MLGVLACALVLVPQLALDFPESPVPSAFAEGQSLWASRKGIDRTNAGDRKVVGSFFDGRIKKGADVVVWVSPEWVSRRLGYLEAQNRWLPTETATRWTAVSRSLSDRLAFAVRLCALRSLTGLDGDVGPKADPREVFDVRFILTSGPGLVERKPRTLDLPWDRLGAKPYRSKDLEGWPFQLEAPSADLLAGFERREGKDLLGLDPVAWSPLGAVMGGVRDAPNGLAAGGNFVALYFVSFPINELRLHPEGFDLRIVSRNKERVASFRVPK